MSESNWVRIMAKSAESCLWVFPDGEGRPELGEWRDRSGRDVRDVIATGQINSLDFPVTFRTMPECDDQERGDILWCGGGKFLPVSTRFVDAVESLGLSGWKTYDITVVDDAGQPIPGFVGFLPDLTGTVDLTTLFWRRKAPHHTLLATGQVVEGLRGAGVDEFDVLPLRKQDDTPPRT